MGGGYLPNDVYTVPTKDEAIRAVAEDARRFEDDEFDTPANARRTKRGSAREGLIVFQRQGRGVMDLGYYFEWDGPCSELECVDDEDF
jgi:hypothetical protein